MVTLTRRLWERSRLRPEIVRHPMPHLCGEGLALYKGLPWTLVRSLDKGWRIIVRNLSQKPIDFLEEIDQILIMSLLYQFCIRTDQMIQIILVPAMFYPLGLGRHRVRSTVTPCLTSRNNIGTGLGNLFSHEKSLISSQSPGVQILSFYR